MSSFEIFGNNNVRKIPIKNTIAGCKEFTKKTSTTGTNKDAYCIKPTAIVFNVSFKKFKLSILDPLSLISL